MPFSLFFIYYHHSYALLSMTSSLTPPSGGWPWPSRGFEFFLRIWTWHAAHHQPFHGKAFAWAKLPHHRHAPLRIHIRLRGQFRHDGHLFETWVAFVRHNVFVAKRTLRVG